MGVSISTLAAAAIKEEARRLLRREPAASAGYHVLPVQRPRPACELASSSFLRTDAQPTRPQEHLDYLDGECEATEDDVRYNPHYSEEGLAAERRVVLKALELYNAMHPGNEYELVPGVVVRSSEPGDNCCWTHGNFVGRAKRSGCFSFLPAPRALFFFEHVDRADFQGAVTCIRLDEPVTEACNFLGFPLGWGTRRLGWSTVATVALIFCIVFSSRRGHVHVEIAGLKKYVKCAMVAAMCCIRSGENSSLGIANRAIPTV